MLVLVAAVAFGLAHAYQGRAGILLTGLLGGVMAALYLGTGSLLLPVLLHAAIDLRFLLVPTRALPTENIGTHIRHRLNLTSVCAPELGHAERRG